MLSYPPPAKCWYPTRIVDGVQLWASREWKVGEKDAYLSEVNKPNA